VSPGSRAEKQKQGSHFRRAHLKALVDLHRRYLYPQLTRTKPVLLPRDEIDKVSQQRLAGCDQTAHCCSCASSAGVSFVL
jgi:hypothetical protein